MIIKPQNHGHFGRLFLSQKNAREFFLTFTRSKVTSLAIYKSTLSMKYCLVTIKQTYLAQTVHFNHFSKHRKQSLNRKVQTLAIKLSTSQTSPTSRKNLWPNKLACYKRNNQKIAGKFRKIVFSVLYQLIIVIKRKSN